MENTHNEPLQFLDSLVKEKRKECEERLQENASNMDNGTVVKDEYAELSRQLHILTKKNEDYKKINESLEQDYVANRKLNKDLRDKVIKVSCELKYTLDEFAVIEEKYNRSHQEEKSLRESSIALESDVENTKSKLLKRQKELAEIKKTEKFYTLRINQLSTNLTDQKVTLEKFDKAIVTRKAQLKKCHQVSAKLESKISDMRTLSDHRQKTIHSLKSKEKTEAAQLNKRSLELKKIQEHEQKLHKQLLSDDQDVKSRRKEQGDVLEQINAERRKISTLSLKEKKMKSNVAKMNKNEAKLDKELSKIEKTKQFYTENQVKLNSALNEKFAIIKEKIAETEYSRKELALEKEQTTQIYGEYNAKREEIVHLKQQNLNLSNEVILTKNENEKVKSQIQGFKNDIINLSARYNSKINELKSIENVLHSNVSLLENCKREISNENI
jgi:chromosome segregation ATPase